MVNGRISCPKFRELPLTAPSRWSLVITLICEKPVPPIRGRLLLGLSCIVKRGPLDFLFKTAVHRLVARGGYMINESTAKLVNVHGLVEVKASRLSFRPTSLSSPFDVLFLRRIASKVVFWRRMIQSFLASVSECDFSKMCLTTNTCAMHLSGYPQSCIQYECSFSFNCQCRHTKTQLRLCLCTPYCQDNSSRS